MRTLTVSLALAATAVLAQSTTDSPVVPNSMAAPIGLTWYVGFKQDVGSVANMQHYNELQAFVTFFSQSLWQTTGGQVFIYRVKVFDSVHGSGNYQNPDALPTGIDVWIKPWNDEPSSVGAYVYSGAVGRVSKIIVVPPVHQLHYWIHESGHFIWNLSWQSFPGLLDEYADEGAPGWQQEDCIMNDGFGTLTFCKENHIVRMNQGAVSCWQQILADYPQIKYSGKATSAPPAVPIFEFFDGAPPGTPIATSGGNPTGIIDLAANAISSSRVDLVWSDGSGSFVDGFRIERSVDGVNFSSVGTVDAPARSFSDKTVSAGTTYTLRVVAFNEFGDAQNSPVAVVTTPAIPKEPWNGDHPRGGAMRGICFVSGGNGGNTFWILVVLAAAALFEVKRRSHNRVRSN